MPLAQILLQFNFAQVLCELQAVKLQNKLRSVYLLNHLSSFLLQQSKVSHLSTRSAASRRLKGWTASMNECHPAETPCPVTPASTLSIRLCRPRPMALRARPAVAATIYSDPALIPHGRHSD